MMGYGMMGGFGLLGLIFNLAMVIGVVILIVWAVRRFSGGTSSSGGQTPREILQVRYANGEITREQFKKMLSDVT